ncbi:MAG: ADP-ribosylglycohydrolase family protein [Bacteroidales bacterium]|nr:ADP-ribosylglycohydrolase family protein [Bacteroidales bacterium]
MKNIGVLFLLLFLLVLPANAGNKYKTITREVLKDKVAGGWAGKMIGVTYGHEMEYKAVGKMYDGEIPWTPEMVEESLLEDDIYGQLSFMMIMEKYGQHVSAEKLAEGFANEEFPLCHANLQGRKNFMDGIMPPLSGTPMYNMHADDIDFQIESDFIGFMNPGMPHSSAKMCNKVGRIMAYGDGLYGGIFLSTMHTLAYFDNNLERIVTDALKAIPAKSTYALCIRDVIDGYKKHPDDWRKTWQEIQDKWGKTDICIPYHDFDIDAKINGAFVVMGLLYGHGDFETTMQISIRCGQDTDCNSSNVAAVLGIVKGYSNISEKFKSYISVITDKNFLYTDYSYKKTVSQTLVFINENVIVNGGEINGDVYQIKIQEPSFKGNLEQSFSGMFMSYQIQVRDSAKWTFKGKWKDFVYGDGDSDLYKMATEPGASLEMPFEGTGVTLLGSWNVDGGRANVYVDGKFIRKIDAYYREEAGKYDVNRAHIFHILGLRPGKHTLNLIVSEDKNPKSTGHKIWVERMVVYATRK